MIDHVSPQSTYDDVLEEIARLCKRAERQRDAVKLMAVSKKQPIEAIRALLERGHRLFGENRVQEAEDKWPELRKQFPEAFLALIGPLQSNKARNAVQLFDRIDSVDREKIAKTLARVMGEENRQLPVLIQVNTGEEPQKAGILPPQADEFISYCKADLGLKVDGLMCIPPADDHPAPHFALLRQIAERHQLNELSMGMSGDFADAIQLGATTIRLGTAVFGARS